MRYPRFVTACFWSALTLLMLPRLAMADVIVGYESSDQPSLSPTAAPFTTGIDLTHGSGLTLANSTSDFGTSGWNQEADDFLQWGFSDTSPGNWDLTTVELATNISGGAPTAFELEVTTAFGTSVFGPEGAGLMTFNVSSITDVKAATFRLFGTSGSGGNVLIPSGVNIGGTSFDVVVNGTYSAVPEPGSLMICGLVAAPVVLRRGRR